MSPLCRVGTSARGRRVRHGARDLHDWSIMRIAGAALIPLLSTGARAYAQATSFAELRGRLSVGETIIVTNGAGENLQGRVLQVSDNSRRSAPPCAGPPRNCVSG
jgi:hypothetical protein